MTRLKSSGRDKTRYASFSRQSERLEPLLSKIIFLELFSLNPFKTKFELHSAKKEDLVTLLTMLKPKICIDKRHSVFYNTMAKK